MIADCLKCESNHTESMIETATAGRKIGYVRVSDADQSEALQVDALTQAGCEKLYHDHECDQEILDDDYVSIARPY